MLRHFIVWSLAILFWVLLREFGQEIVRPRGIEPMNFLQRIRFHLVLGTAAGVLFGSIEFIFIKYVYKKTSFGATILIGAASYLVATFLIATIAFRSFTNILGIDTSWERYQQFISSDQILLMIAYCFIIGFLIDFLREVDKKFGPGNLWKMLKGEFYSPKEEQRIFMFLDLKNSTGLAEQLGHQLYSKLIQMCFQDVSEIVQQYKANIYQYVGDEIVLTWSVTDGLQQLNCVKFFFAYQAILQKNSSDYRQKFGVVPEFKAGLEMGHVMVAEVGDIKRDIAYHGDVLNTASRIQGCCNQYGKQIIISENLERSLRNSLKEHLELLGDIQLRGKQQNIKIYAVDQLYAA